MADETNALRTPSAGQGSSADASDSCLETCMEGPASCITETIETVGPNRAGPAFVGMFFMLIASILLIVNYEGEGIRWGRSGQGSKVNEDTGGAICGSFLGLGFLICCCSFICPCCMTEQPESETIPILSPPESEPAA